MGAYCTCETSALDKENLIQYEFGEKEKILSEIKPKLKNFNNAEFISKEEFDKILSSFPNVNELRICKPPTLIPNLDVYPTKVRI